MNVTREEAAEALKTIDKAGEKLGRLQGYHHGAPFFVLWGLVWLLANAVTQFWPEHGGIAWMTGVGAGVVLSATLGAFQGYRGVYAGAKRQPNGMGWRIGFTWVIIFAFIGVIITLAQPETSRQGNAMVSILFPFMYMAGGVWAGWRLFAIGLVTAVGILFGYFYVKDYFDLWMAVFGGGSLIAGGIWLRTA